MFTDRDLVRALFLDAKSLFMGAELTWGGRTPGGTWNIFLSFLQVFSKNPVIINALSTIVFCLSVIYFSFSVARVNQTLLITIILTSFGSFYSTHVLWNPSLALTLGFIAFGLFNHKKEKPLASLIIGLLVAAACQSHLSFLILFLQLLTLYWLHHKEHIKLYALGFCLLYLPYFIFDALHEFHNTKFLIQLAIESISATGKFEKPTDTFWPWDMVLLFLGFTPEKLSSFIYTLLILIPLILSKFTKKTPQQSSIINRGKHKAELTILLASILILIITNTEIITRRVLCLYPIYFYIIGKYLQDLNKKSMIIITLAIITKFSLTQRDLYTNQIKAINSYSNIDMLYKELKKHLSLHDINNNVAMAKLIDGKYEIISHFHPENRYDNAFSYLLNRDGFIYNSLNISHNCALVVTETKDPQRLFAKYKIKPENVISLTPFRIYFYNKNNCYNSFSNKYIKHIPTAKDPQKIIVNSGKFKLSGTGSYRLENLRRSIDITVYKKGDYILIDSNEPKGIDGIDNIIIKNVKICSEDECFGSFSNLIDNEILHITPFKIDRYGLNNFHIEGEIEFKEEYEKFY